MSEKVETKAEKKEKKEKKPAGETFKLTLELYKSGKSIDEIAVERGLASATIASHLARFVDMGILNINTFISEEKRAKAMKLLENSDELGSVYQTLGSILDRTEVTFFLSWMRSQKKTE